MPDPKDFLPQPPWKGPPVPRIVSQSANDKLEAINRKWRELDELQIKLHLDCMSPRKWAVLNSLDAIGLELTKGYTAINSYIEEKMETINKALEDLKQSGEIDPRY